MMKKFGKKFNVGAVEFQPGAAAAAAAVVVAAAATNANGTAAGKNGSVDKASKAQQEEKKKKFLFRKKPGRNANEACVQLQHGTYECLICCEPVRQRNPIWTCKQCYLVLHIKCCQKWYQQCLSTGSSHGHCPACRTAVEERPEASCYCGKETEIQLDNYANPHSCGQMCGRLRQGSDCPHPCSLVCHPGPCPPCAATGNEKHCNCGKTSYRLRCGAADPVRCCNGTCAKSLNCSKHTCPLKCHPGPCPKCSKFVHSDCFCLKESRDISCGDPVPFSCGRPCGRPLTCGHHECTQPCHSGPCAPCSLAAATTCPCGATPLRDLAPNRSSCLEPIPLCQHICNKQLPCGHKCKQKCHYGECQRCAGVISQPCRCGSKTITQPCATATFPFLCDKPCNTKMSCKRHVCHEKCCDLSVEDHLCFRPCGKKLSCKQHYCEMPCHPSRCHECYHANMTEITCGCGATSIPPPTPCGTTPPHCPNRCHRNHPCGHAASHPCHLDHVACAPCVVLVTKSCICGKKILTAHCSMPPPSCGQVCDQLLPCGLHRCPKVCHSGVCVDAAEEASCGYVCKAALACGHPCQNVCHPGAPCPPAVCEVDVVVKCPCGHLSQTHPCHQLPVTVECSEECSSAVRREQLRLRRAQEWLPDWLWESQDGIKQCWSRVNNYWVLSKYVC